MSLTHDIIEVTETGQLNFGKHEVIEKQKVNDFEIEGDTFKVKTHNEITRLEKNGRLLYESVPGTTVKGFSVSAKEIEFGVFSDAEDASLTVEMEPEAEYKIYINQVQVGKVKANLAGKISLGVDFASGQQNILIQEA